MAGKKAFCELQFSDAFMFAAAMEDEEICRQVLERVLGIPVKKVRVRTESTLLVNSDYRCVRLDVQADGNDHSAFNAEMQTTHKRNLPKRTRLYQGERDIASLKPGADFNDLPKSFIVFICTFDPFGHGLYRYTFANRCQETGEELGDEAYKVFLNTKGKNDADEPPELVDFLKYVEDASYAEDHREDALIHRIESRITYIKRDREMEVKYMLFSEMLSDERQEGKAEGRAEGIQEGLQKGQQKERDNLFRLMDLMEADGHTDQLPLLRKDAGFLQEMYKKYHIED